MTTTHSVAPQPARPLDGLTVITSSAPASVGKTFELVSGEIVKHQVANITAGIARSYVASTADNVRDVLNIVTQRANQVLCPSLWHGDDDGVPFEVITEGELARLTGHPVGSQELAGIHELNGRRVAARLRRGLDPSEWLLLDLDNPVGIPDEWRALNMAERLAKFAELVPGIDTCERVELRGSSARVVPPGGQPGGATHAYVRVNDPHMIATLKAYVAVAMVTAGLSFPSPRYSRVDGTVIGHVHRTVFDLAVLDPGRLIFCAMPQLSDEMIEAGWTVADADVRIVNEGGGVLDVSGYALPTPEMLADYAAATGEYLALSNRTGSLAVRSSGLLTMTTPVESRGVVRTFGEWIAGLRDGQSMRCEAPFRASVSEAAVLTRHSSISGIIHDVGNSTTYHLDQDGELSGATARLAERLREALSPAAVAAAVAESEASHAADEAATEANAQRVARAAAELEDAEDLFASVVHHVTRDPATIPRRDWLMAPAYLRGMVSVVIAPGGVGKSLMLLAEAVSLAAGRALLEPRTPTRAYRVAYIMAEDDADEVELRLAAINKRHGFRGPEYDPRLFVMPGVSFPLTRVSGNGSPEEAAGIVDALINFLKREGIDALIVDPLVSFNKAGETNEGMQCAIEAFRRVAAEAKVAVRIAHHTNKAGDGDVRSSRGGTALTDGVRHADALAKMTREEAQAAGVPTDKRRNYVRLVDGKANYAAVDDDRWFRIDADPMANGDPGVVLVPWRPDPVAAPYSVVEAVHAYLTTHGPQPSNIQAGAWFGWEVGRLAGVDVTDHSSLPARALIGRWLKALADARVIVGEPGIARNGAGNAAPGYRAGVLPGAAAWRGVL